jgi:hypothetical protein
VLNASYISPNLRFEVDGAFATTKFVENQVEHDHSGAAWDANRLQVLWDSVALSAEFAISLHKQATVAAVPYGVGLDLNGPGRNVTAEEYGNVLTAFPHLNFYTGVKDAVIALCVQKPTSTYG